MKKWAVRIVLFVFISALLSILFIDRELSKMYGGHTDIAETSLIDNTPAYFSITNVNVLSPSSEAFANNQTIVINEGKIVSVGADVKPIKDTYTINGNGMFLVPGYTDSHIHLLESENDLLLYVANGVTQVREMNGSKTHLRWKKQIENGRIGPDLFVASPQLASFGFFEGLFVSWTQNKVIVRSEKQVNKKVRLLKNTGYDAIKASSFLNSESYIALGNAAVSNEIPLIGHVPIAVDLENFLNSPQTETAHVEELVKGLDREFGGYTKKNTEEFLDFIRGRSENLAEQLFQNGKSVTSTISLTESFSEQKANLDALLSNPKIQYANPGITEGTFLTSRGAGWLPNVNPYRWPDDWDKARRDGSYNYWQTYTQAQYIIFAALIKKGVPIMAGTDANNPVAVPGFSLHEEMIALNKAGMSPSQALASATAVPARWMQTDTGEIRAGLKANLVLLKSNPLEDIRAVKSIEMVIVNGHVLSRKDLDKILLSVKNANDKSRNVELEQ